MKTKLLLITPFLLFLFCSGAFAQDDIITKPDNDYVINLKNDTIRCTIKTSFFGNGGYNVQWKTGQEKKWKKMDGNFVKEYFTAQDTNTFIFKQVPGNEKMNFVQWVERGKINLYSDFYGNELYANKDESELKLIKVNTALFAKGTHKSRIKAFMDMIADNPDLLSRFKEARKNADYSFELIRYYIKTYDEEYLESHKNSN